MSTYLSCNFITRMRQLGIEIEVTDNDSFSGFYANNDRLEPKLPSEPTPSGTSGEKRPGKTSRLG
jgi:hypothetical protein